MKKHFILKIIFIIGNSSLILIFSRQSSISVQKSKQSVSLKNTKTPAKKNTLKKEIEELADLPETLANIVAKNLGGGKISSGEETLLVVIITKFIKTGLADKNSEIYTLMKQLHGGLGSLTDNKEAKKKLLEYAAEKIQVLFTNKENALDLANLKDLPLDEKKKKILEMIDSNAMKDFLNKNPSESEKEQFAALISLKAELLENEKNPFKASKDAIIEKYIDRGGIFNEK